MENVTLLHSQMNGTLYTGRKGLRDRMLKKCGTHSLISIIKVSTTDKHVPKYTPKKGSKPIYLSLVTESINF